MGLKKIARNINLLNVLLLSAVAFFTAYQLSPLLSMKVRYALPAVREKTVKQKEVPAQAELPSITEYAMISEENLFHPERRIPPDKKDEEPLQKPDFVLYGTLISDDLRLAYLDDLKAPRTSAGRGKRQTVLKKGDTMGGFTLKEIEADKIVMVRGEEKIVVPINDPAHPKTREGSGVPEQKTPEAPASTQRKTAHAPAAKRGVSRPTPMPRSETTITPRAAGTHSAQRTSPLQARNPFTPKPNTSDNITPGGFLRLGR